MSKVTPLKKQNQNKNHLALKEISPLTKTQEVFFEKYNEGYNLIGHGYAGTGKTYIALYLAFQDLLEGNYGRVIIVRSSVSSRDIGHLPGNEKEKMSVFEAPYQDICSDLFRRGDAYNLLKSEGKLQFVSSSFIRGMTFDNCIIIVDECQNLSFGELYSIITRVGENAKIIFCGDTKQSDLRGSDKKGYKDFEAIIKKMKEFKFVEFNSDDIVRSAMIKSFIIESEKYFNSKP